jgi:hypothetical protein
MNAPFPIRQECPPGACNCRREELLENPQSDWRVLRLTREEEKRLVARLETLENLADLRRMEARMQEQLGIFVTITPSERGVRTSRGIRIQLVDQPGLCRKVKESIPAAIRRAMERTPELAFEILNSHDLLDGT